MKVYSSVSQVTLTYEYGGLVTYPENWVEGIISCDAGEDSFACRFQVYFDDHNVKKFTYLDTYGKVEVDYNDNFIAGGFIGDDNDSVTDEIIWTIETQDGPVQVYIIKY